jgi:hypothetical protein
VGSRSSRRSTKRASAARTNATTTAIATKRQQGAPTSAPQSSRRERSAAASASAPTSVAHTTVASHSEAAPRQSVFDRMRGALKAELPPRRVLVAGAIALMGGSATIAAIGVRRSSINVHTLTQMGLIALAGASVAVADMLIKRAAVGSVSFSAVISHPMMLLALALYLVQIVLFAYVFLKNWDLSLVGLSQMIVYAATVIFVGIILFQERITVAHAAGMAWRWPVPY